MSTAPAHGRSDGAAESWKLDNSTAITCWSGSATASSTGQPMLPQAVTVSPAARRIDSSIPVVVVLPLVPVTTSHRRGAGSARSIRQASSVSPITSTPAATAEAGNRPVGRTPGEVTTRPTPAGRSTGSPICCTPSGIAVVTGRSAATSTGTPAAASTRMAASPATPAPITTTGRSPATDRRAVRTTSGYAPPVTGQPPPVNDSHSA